jgi:4-aminobutyrate aminotransferase-like enzyme
VSRLEPRPVPPVHTKYRRISTAIPVPESIAILDRLRAGEPASMAGQPPVVWDRAHGVQVYDRWGNMWLDWSSGVLVANVGHSHQRVVQAIVDTAQRGLLHHYCFPSEIRARLVEQILRVAPRPLDRVFLLTTGSEAIESAIKLARAHGQRLGGRRKINLVGFEGAFHGRTLGAQLAGGIASQKSWIVNLDPGFVQVPFPDGFRTRDVGFELFERTLTERGIDPDTVCGVLTESYQGGGASFAPHDYMQALRRWCDRHGALLIVDEVQAGFGRTGKWFAFEHYGLIPDLICAAKGISGSLPLSAVIGRAEVMNLYGPEEMTSTHSGNPVCAAAALANLQVIEEEGLVERAARVGALFQAELAAVRAEHADVIGAHHGRGLVAGLHVVRPGTDEPDGALARRAVTRGVEKGLLMFWPVGVGSATIKAAPPLVITEDAVREGAAVLREARRQ